MDGVTTQLAGPLALIDLGAWLGGLWLFLQVLIGFSAIIFVHELGHFLAAKWCGVRVNRFAVGFGSRLFGYRQGEGFTFGNRPNYTPAELAEKNYGETDYCFNLLPVGGYVKMLGEHDFDIDEKTGEIKMSDDPRAFTNKPVGSRMIVVSAGVVFNLLFAGLLFMSVFLIGHKLVAPVVGVVVPDSPADRAGLRAGDRLLAVDGKAIQLGWGDFAMRELLSGNEPLAVRVERDGAPLDQPLMVTPEPDPLDGRPSAGAGPTFSLVFAEDWPDVNRKPGPRAGDRLRSVNGREYRGQFDLEAALRRSGGAPLELQVERRRTPGDPNAETTLETVFVRPALRFADGGADSGDDTEQTAPPNLLGFAPRVAIGLVQEDAPAYAAGMRTKDVIVRAGAITDPTRVELLEVIRNSNFEPIPFEVLRGDEVVSFSVTARPRERYKPFGDRAPMIGANVEMHEQRRVVVAAVLPGTPAAASGIPRGAELLAVDGRSLGSWADFLAELMSAPGETVELRYRSGGREATVALAVPSSVYNETGMEPDSYVASIDEHSKVKGADGKPRVVAHPPGLEFALRQRLNQRVKIKLISDLGRGAARVVEFVPTPTNVFPWQLRHHWLLERGSRSEPVMMTVTSGGNPLKALWMGTNVVLQNVLVTYESMKQLASQRVGTENLSGPVGIFVTVKEQAKIGLTNLLFVLAYLSVSLAVLNFLPLPVVDGGLMVFLLIEKIRGKPLSIKTQMASTMVGLAVIALIFIVVTFQDISKLLP